MADLKDYFQIEDLKNYDCYELLKEFSVYTPANKLAEILQNYGGVGYFVPNLKDLNIFT